MSTRTMSLLHDKTVLIIGLGLIGGSIARGLARDAQCRVLAHSRNRTMLQTASEEGSIHGYDTDLAVLAPQADLIIITTPTLTVKPVLSQLKELVAGHTVITDAASVKGSVAAAGRELFADSLHRFVPGHPIAGSEQSGYSASRNDLYNDRKVILTPLPESSPAAIGLVMAVWQALGAEVHLMSVERHDQVLAATSHLPHLLAYTLVNTLTDAVAEPDQTRQVFDYAAGGFADFSRIASSDPVMWRDIFMSNADATVQVLDAYMLELQRMRQLIRRVDGDGMFKEFTRAKQVRDDFIQRFRGQPAPTEATNRLLLTCYPGFALLGSYRPAAHRDVTLKALDAAIAQPGTTVIEGVMPSADVRRAVRDRTASGVPVAGPEHGRLRVYGPPPADTAAAAGEPLMTTVQVLPADALIVGMLALTVVLQPGSSLTLEAAASARRSALLLCLADMGMRFNVQSRGLQIVHTGLALQSVSNSSAVVEDGLLDEEVLVLLLAMLMASGESRINLPLEQAQRTWQRIQPWCDAGATIESFDDEPGLRSQWKVQGRHGFDWSARDICCGDDAALALLTGVVAQRVGSASLHVRCSHELGRIYPGLLADLGALGFGISVAEDGNE